MIERNPQSIEIVFERRKKELEHLLDIAYIYAPSVDLVNGEIAGKPSHNFEIDQTLPQVNVVGTPNPFDVILETSESHLFPWLYTAALTKIGEPIHAIQKKTNSAALHEFAHYAVALDVGLQPQLGLGYLHIQTIDGFKSGTVGIMGFARFSGKLDNAQDYQRILEAPGRNIGSLDREDLKGLQQSISDWNALVRK